MEDVSAIKNSVLKTGKSGRAKGIVFGTRKKECSECGEESPVAKRHCPCGYSFPKRSKSIEERMPKGQTNVTEQKYQLKAKQAVLLRDHDLHSVVFLAKKTSNGYLFEISGTSGWASDFFQKSSDVSSNGAFFFQSFETCFKEAFPMSPPNSEETYEHSESIKMKQSMKNLFQAPAQIRKSVTKIPVTPTSAVKKRSDSIDNNKEEKQVILYKRFKEISARDVVPIYAEASDPEDYWFLMVTSKNKFMVTGRYLREFRTDGIGRWCTFDGQPYNVKRTSIMRYDRLADEFFVLPKYTLTSGKYLIPSTVLNMCNVETKDMPESAD